MTRCEFKSNELMAVLSTILEATSALAVRAAESDKFARDSAVVISQEAERCIFLATRHLDQHLNQAQAPML